MSIGTGAFSSAEAERGVEVNVVEDDEAYLGLEAEREITAFGRSADVVEIRNSFAADLTLTVSVAEPNEVVEDITVAGEEPPAELTLAPGGDEWVAVTCEQIGEAAFSLQFSGDAGGTSVEKTRTFDGIPVAPVSQVEFNGNGSVHVHGEFTELVVTVNGGPRTETITANKSGKGVIPPKGEQINRVKIGETVYKRDGNGQND
ncbi:hypothetical protein [Halorubrum sp. CSM-61]|uniref:hypothetical protein n=1 Tax=Halorubrum sp. CSM-61 TaxID=2485838 RepID=UPI0013DDEE71|nr:hypothetical protein [Halorubrum sp. CSM-61]